MAARGGYHLQAPLQFPVAMIEAADRGDSSLNELRGTVITDFVEDGDPIEAVEAELSRVAAAAGKTFKTLNRKAEPVMPMPLGALSEWLVPSVYSYA